jgi:hypothetical protein
MCKQVQSVAEGVLTAEEPVFLTLLTDIGQSTTTNGEAAIAAYKAFETAVENFQVGSTITEVESALNAFLAVWNVIPIPADAQALGDVVVAAVEGVLGLLGGNSTPAPAPDGTAATPEEVQAHQAAYISHASAEIQAKVPWVKVTRTDRMKVLIEGGKHVGATKFKQAWEPAQTKAEAVNPKYANLKIA